MLQKKYYKDSVPKYDTITHIGKIDKSNKKNTVLYKVVRNGGSVTVTHDNPSWTREMDYNTFFMFTMDK
ncbi:hypothetical protein KA013_04585 [Patescibacteria group bacterium]|nr:hypothetical protein [Patescibacteria group bacterium]